MKAQINKTVTACWRGGRTPVAWDAFLSPKPMTDALLCASTFSFTVRLHDSISEEGFHYLVFDLWVPAGPALLHNVFRNSMFKSDTSAANLTPLAAICLFGCRLSKKNSVSHVLQLHQIAFHVSEMFQLKRSFSHFRFRIWKCTEHVWWHITTTVPAIHRTIRKKSHSRSIESLKVCFGSWSFTMYDVTNGSQRVSCQWCNSGETGGQTWSSSP